MSTTPATPTNNADPTKVDVPAPNLPATSTPETPKTIEKTPETPKKVSKSFMDNFDVNKMSDEEMQNYEKMTPEQQKVYMKNYSLSNYALKKQFYSYKEKNLQEMLSPVFEEEDIRNSVVATFLPVTDIAIMDTIENITKKYTGMKREFDKYKTGYEEYQNEKKKRLEEEEKKKSLEESAKYQQSLQQLPLFRKQQSEHDYLARVNQRFQDPNSFTMNQTTRSQTREVLHSKDREEQRLIQSQNGISNEYVMRFGECMKDIDNGLDIDRTLSQFLKNTNNFHNKIPFK